MPARGSDPVLAHQHVLVTLHDAPELVYPEAPELALKPRPLPFLSDHDGGPLADEGGAP